VSLARGNGSCACGCMKVPCPLCPVQSERGIMHYSSNARPIRISAATVVLTAGLLAGAAQAQARTKPATTPNATSGRTIVVHGTEPTGTQTTVRIVLDGNRGGSAARLASAQRQRITMLAAPSEAIHNSVGGTSKKPVPVRCNTNPHWSDSNGRLDARFNCKYSNINWGYRISKKVRAIITGPVAEKGVHWWKNGKKMPSNAPHAVGASYHFHGTLKPVKSGDVVQMQDYMTFRVNVGGSTGTGSITWVSHLKAKK
jgi:hypothetical protein